MGPATSVCTRPPSVAFPTPAIPRLPTNEGARARRIAQGHLHRRKRPAFRRPIPAWPATCPDPWLPTRFLGPPCLPPELGSLRNGRTDATGPRSSVTAGRREPGIPILRVARPYPPRLLPQTACLVLLFTADAHRRPRRVPKFKLASCESSLRARRVLQGPAEQAASNPVGPELRTRQ